MTRRGQTTCPCFVAKYPPQSSIRCRPGLFVRAAGEPAGRLYGREAGLQEIPSENQGPDRRGATTPR